MPAGSFKNGLVLEGEVSTARFAAGARGDTTTSLPNALNRTSSSSGILGSDPVNLELRPILDLV